MCRRRASAPLAEERRLFYVAMTRARDELILTHAAESAGGRARRVSPFVIEALDLPTAGRPRARRRRPPSASGRLAAFAATDAPAGARRAAPITEPLTLSLSQIDDYLTCPRRYKYAQVVRVPPAPHHAMVYGAALHKAVQEFHQRQARGHVMTETELARRFEAAWSNEGFVSREHEAARLEAGRAALRRFREATSSQPEPVVPT